MMKALDNINNIKGIDKSDMLKLIKGLPYQCEKASLIADGSPDPKIDIKIDNIVFSALGGSAIGADLVKTYLKDELNIPAFVCRNYSLPAFAGKNTLIFCISYSGNTEEVLSSFKEACSRGSFIITIGSGGKLKEESKKNGLMHIDIPGGLPPRTTIGYTSIILLKIFSKIGLIKDRSLEIKGLRPLLEGIERDEIGMDVPYDKNISKILAESILGKFAILYGTSDTTEIVVNRWRSQLAENSKVLSSSHVLPEMNHNEIVGYEIIEKDILKHLKVIMFRDQDDNDRTKLRIDITKEIISKKGIDVLEVERKEKTQLYRIFSLIYIGDYVSFYLSMLNNIDPTPVEKIDYLKKRLKSV
ncbi:MAG: bifunctional phosphoglucose/phosphomannose isomerase [Candidatus Omnitrophota bacterium]